MKRKLLLLVVFVVSLTVALPAFASTGTPVGGCSPRYELHPFMDHSGDPQHRHIGTTLDLNGDGFICMKMLPNDLHLHVDNALPLP